VFPVPRSRRLTRRSSPTTMPRPRSASRSRCGSAREAASFSSSVPAPTLAAPARAFCAMFPLTSSASTRRLLPRSCPSAHVYAPRTHVSPPVLCLLLLFAANMCPQCGSLFSCFPASSSRALCNAMMPRSLHNSVACSHVAPLNTPPYQPFCSL